MLESPNRIIAQIRTCFVHKILFGKIFRLILLQSAYCAYCLKIVHIIAYK